MAIPHFSVTSGSRQKGNSAKTRFLYLVRQGKYEDRDDLEYVEHRNYPDWAKGNPIEFWQASDDYERANGRVYTQIECALPRELSPGERLLLIKHFLDRELGERHPYTFVVHNPVALDGKENPHLHVLFSERTIDGIERPKELFFKRRNSKHPEQGGAAKNRDWNRKNKITELRASWEQAVNQALEKAGRKERINLSSLKKQGIDRIPEPKMGPAVTAQYKRGEKTWVGDVVEQCRALRQKEAHLTSIDKELKQCKEELAEASVKHISASELYQIVSKEKHALYKKLAELKEKRYQLGVRWTPRGDRLPAPLTEEQAYEKALKDVGGSEQKVLLQLKVKQALEEDRNRHQSLRNIDSELEALESKLNETKKYQAELKLLGNETLALRPEVTTLSNKQALADRNDYQQKLRQARTKASGRTRT